MKGLPKLSVKICALLLCIFLPFNIANAYHKNYATPHLARDSKQAFDGFYFGAEGGYIRAEDNRNLSNTVAGTTYNLPDQIVQQDFLGGVFLGFGAPIHHYYYIGIQAEMLFNSGGTAGKDQLAVINNNGTNIANVHYSFALEHMINLVLTPGYFVSARTLFYFRLGVTFANLRLRNQIFGDLGGGNSSVNQATDIFRGGMVFGAGVKVAVNDHFTIFMEGNYYTYSRVNFDPITVNTTPTFFDAQSRVHVFSLLFGAAYGFAL